MSLDRLRYELKIMGRWAILGPFVTLVGLALFALLLVYLHADPQRFLMAVAEMLLPLLGGIIVGVVSTQDPSLELHLTLPRKYHLTGLLRLALVLLCVGLLSLVFLNGLIVFHLLNLPPLIQKISSPSLTQFLIVQGIWLVPLCWCVAVGFCFALIIQGWTGNVALLGGIWIAETIFRDLIASTDWLRPFLLFPTTLLLYGVPPKTPLNVVQDAFARYWVYPHLELLGMVLVFVLLGWLLLCNTERMLKGTTAE
jgi:hypothetical protein